MGFNIHLEFRQYKFSEVCRDTFVSTNKTFCIAWIKNIFLLFLCIFPLITITLTISFTIKRRLFARKEWLAKRNKATLISLCSRGRATSADIGRELHPLRLVRWALQGAQLWKGKRKRSHFFNWPYLITVCWRFIWRNREQSVYYIYKDTSNETSFSLQRLSNCVNNCVNFL